MPLTKARCSQMQPRVAAASATRSVPSVASSFLDPCGRHRPAIAGELARSGATDPTSAYDGR